jgi:hypothetical protein
MITDEEDEILFHFSLSAIAMNNRESRREAS